VWGGGRWCGGFVQVVDHFKNDTKTLKDFPNQSDTTLGLIEHSEYLDVINHNWTKIID